jgi:hypothetical protein
MALTLHIYSTDGSNVYDLCIAAIYALLLLSLAFIISSHSLNTFSPFRRSHLRSSSMSTKQERAPSAEGGRIPQRRPTPLIQSGSEEEEPAIVARPTIPPASASVPVEANGPGQTMSGRMIALGSEDKQRAIVTQPTTPPATPPPSASVPLHVEASGPRQTQPGRIIELGSEDKQQAIVTQPTIPPTTPPASGSVPVEASGPRQTQPGRIIELGSEDKQQAIVTQPTIPPTTPPASASVLVKASGRITCTYFIRSTCLPGRIIESGSEGKHPVSGTKPTTPPRAADVEANGSSERPLSQAAQASVEDEQSTNGTQANPLPQAADVEASSILERPPSQATQAVVKGKRSTNLNFYDLTLSAIPRFTPLPTPLLQAAALEAVGSSKGSPSQATHAVVKGKQPANRAQPQEADIEAVSSSEGSSSQTTQTTMEDGQPSEGSSSQTTQTTMEDGQPTLGDEPAALPSVPPPQPARVFSVYFDEFHGYGPASWRTPLQLLQRTTLLEARPSIECKAAVKAMTSLLFSIHGHENWFANLLTEMSSEK